MHFELLKFYFKNYLLGHFNIKALKFQINIYIIGNDKPCLASFWAIHVILLFEPVH